MDGGARARHDANRSEHQPISLEIKYIIGNEGCERFSFYGMKNILTFFMINSMLIHEHVAKANYTCS